MADTPEIQEQGATISPSLNPSMIGRDETIDIQSLLRGAKKDENEEKREMSPLEQMKAQKESGAGLGMVVNNSDLEAANRVTPKGNKTEMDAVDEIDKYNAEQDKLIEVAQQVTFDKRPTSLTEMVQMMDTLETAAKTGVMNHQRSEDTAGMVQMTEEQQAAAAEARNNGEANIQNTLQDTPMPKQEVDTNIVNVLIDKTGFGGDFAFTEEEREKLFSANEIRLTEVEDIDIHSLNIITPQKSFLETVDEYQISGASCPMVFPASRFRAHMKGLTYGEMGDIALDPDSSVTIDQVHKKLSVIYNKMENPTCGKFTSFDDFLKKFSYIDMDLAVYGLVVATFPEIDDIPLMCNNPACKKSFNHKFSPRTLLRFEKCNNKFLEAMRDTVNCHMADVDELMKTSPTVTHKIIKMPRSGFLVEIGIASAYDYLYTIIDNILDDKFQENHKDDINGILASNSGLLALVRAVYVPVNGQYMKYEEFEDMIQALCHIKPEEVAILVSLLTKYVDAYATTFELTNVECPHCHTKTESIALDINKLVFLKYQRLTSTVLNSDNIAVL